MIKISCYRTVEDKLSKAFCMLAEKCYNNKINLFVHINTDKALVNLDQTLWTYSKKQFIPHGTLTDPYPEKQPILLGTIFNNLNNAASLMIINATRAEFLGILSYNEEFNSKKCERIFLLYNQDFEINNQEIQDILATSSLSEFKFESYRQGIDGTWQKEGALLNEK